MKRNFYIGAIFLALVAALAAGSVMLEKKTTAEGAEVLAPRFEVDPLWPKPLPNHWVQGMSVGVSVDPRDHVWIVHRTNKIGRASCRERVEREMEHGWRARTRERR